jgi:hypothetical protein
VALRLLPDQDVVLEKHKKTLRSLEKQKKEKLAEKERLESSTQERINALLQERSDVRRLDIYDSLVSFFNYAISS